MGFYSLKALTFIASSTAEYKDLFIEGIFFLCEGLLEEHALTVISLSYYKSFLNMEVQA